jgi:hypothetical protein
VSQPPPPTQPPATPPGPPPAPPPAPPVTPPTQPGTPAAPPPAYPPPSAYPPPGGPPRRGLGGGAIALIVGLVVVVVAGALVFVFTQGDDQPEPLPTPLPTVEPTEQPTVTPTDVPTTQPTTPTEGQALVDLLPPAVGPWTLTGASPDPQAIVSFGATDALVANYVRTDGQQIVHNLMAFGSNSQADQTRNAVQRSLTRDLGYLPIGQLRRGTVVATRFVGPDEVVIWTNGPLLGMVEGPIDRTVDFFLALPY